MTEKSAFELEKEKLTNLVKEEIAKDTAPDDKKEDSAKIVEIAEDAPKDLSADKVDKVVEVKEDKPDNEAFARLRREASEARREKAELEARIAEEKNKKNDINEDPEPNKAEKYEEWLEWKDRKLEKKLKDVEDWKEKETNKQRVEEAAKAEMRGWDYFEKPFAAKTPDYKEVGEFGFHRIASSIKTLNPDISDEALVSATQREILRIANHALASGHENPVEYLYKKAKSEWGYQPPVAKTEEKPIEKKEPKIDLKKIEENKNRSASGAAAGGQGGNAAIGLDGIGTMTMAQFSRLSPQQREDLKVQARSA